MAAVSWSSTGLLLTLNISQTFAELITVNKEHYLDMMHVYKSNVTVFSTEQDVRDHWPLELWNTLTVTLLYTHTKYRALFLWVYSPYQLCIITAIPVTIICIHTKIQCVIFATVLSVLVMYCYCPCAVLLILLYVFRATQHSSLEQHSPPTSGLSPPLRAAHLMGRFEEDYPLRKTGNTSRLPGQ